MNPVVARLHEVGFGIVPVLDMHGGDTGVLAWRCDPVDLVIVTAWSDDFAVGARVPRGRDWSRPFTATVGRRSSGSFAEVVEQVLSGRHRLDERLAGTDCAPFAEGLR